MESTIELSIYAGWESLQGMRPTMEDGHEFQQIVGPVLRDDKHIFHYSFEDEVQHPNINIDGGGMFAGVYDGHDGASAMKFTVNTLSREFMRQLGLMWDSSPDDVTEMTPVWEAAYREVDKQITRRGVDGGTTVATAYLQRSGDDYWLHTANVGDSRIVLVRGKRSLRLTIDHKPTLLSEAERIRALGGYVSYSNRVNGILAVSRAFGNQWIKQYVTCEPHCSNIQLTKDDSFIIIACDGIWDVFSDQEAVNFVLRWADHPVDVIAQKLAHNAIHFRGSSDNVTVQIIKLVF